MSTIPANEVVSVTPGVLAAGGSALVLNGLFLTISSRPPIGSVLPFPSALAVGNFFGPTSLEAGFAAKYFSGFDGSTKKPGSILFSQYPLDNVSAYLRGGNVSTLTLTQLQAFNGTLSVTIDGVLKTGTVNLSGATSFSNAALIIAAALGIDGAQVATFTGAIATQVLTASGVTGQLSVGDVVKGAGVSATTYITSFGTGTGGAGTYNVSVSQSVSSEAMTADAPAVIYDSTSGAFVFSSGSPGEASTITFGSGAMAADLLLTQAAGAVLSQGADAATPAAFMDGVTQQTKNWATLVLAFNPDETGNDIRFAFSEWIATQNNRFIYANFDSDAAPTVTVPAVASLAQRVKTAGISGVCSNWQPDDLDPANIVDLTAFVAGTIASINFDQPNGRTILKFRRQSGLSPGVTDQTTFDNLSANEYNAYGAYATANDAFQWYANGVVSGPFQWIDSYVNQIWLNNEFQLALVNLLLQTNSIPYNASGRAAIEAALADPIQSGLNFGVYRSGVTLSASQVVAVNTAAGREIAPTLSNQGWYLLVGDASPEVRQARGSPPCTFFYVDGEAVQTINLASIALQ